MKTHDTRKTTCSTPIGVRVASKASSSRISSRNSSYEQPAERAGSARTLCCAWPWRTRWITLLRTAPAVPASAVCACARMTTVLLGARCETKAWATRSSPASSSVRRRRVLSAHNLSCVKQCMRWRDPDWPKLGEEPQPTTCGSWITRLLADFFLCRGQLLHLAVRTVTTLCRGNQHTKARPLVTRGFFAREAPKKMI